MGEERTRQGCRPRQVESGGRPGGVGIIELEDVFYSYMAGMRLQRCFISPITIEKLFYLFLTSFFLFRKFFNRYFCSVLKRE